MPTVRKPAAVLAAVALVALSVSCAQSQRGQVGRGATFVFGVPGEPAHFDPLFAQDGETFRPTQQIFETLVTQKPGTVELAPGLATAWTPEAGGTRWRFTLRRGVSFHDGTPLDAAAVCANFERWYDLPSAAAQSRAIYYSDTFGGYRDNLIDGVGPGIYAGCDAPDPTTAVLRLTRARGVFPAAFGLPSLAIQSPAGIARYGGDQVTRSGEAFGFSDYATAHPTGTGPFRFDSFDRAAHTITLVRNERYWGQPARLERLIFRVIPDENARRQELQSGTVDGYDFPPPGDWQRLREAGHQVLARVPFNILYLGINQRNNPALRDVRVRRAIALAVDREALVRTQLPPGAEVATQFVPRAVAGHDDALQAIPHDPARARALLAEAGASNLAVDFWYPTAVSRPYLPDPTTLFTAIAQDLREVGITVNPVARPWNGGYLDGVTANGSHDLHLLGLTGDYDNAATFLAVFFGRPKPEFGFSDQQVFDAVAAGDAAADPQTSAAAFVHANDVIMEYLPAVPLSSSPAALVVRRGVSGLVASPLTYERFDTVSVDTG